MVDRKEDGGENEKKCEVTVCVPEKNRDTPDEKDTIKSEQQEVQQAVGQVQEIIPLEELRVKLVEILEVLSAELHDNILIELKEGERLLQDAEVQVRLLSRLSSDTRLNLASILRSLVRALVNDLTVHRYVNIQRSLDGLKQSFLYANKGETSVGHKMAKNIYYNILSWAVSKMKKTLPGEKPTVTGGSEEEKALLLDYIEHLSRLLGNKEKIVDRAGNGTVIERDPCPSGWDIPAGWPLKRVVYTIQKIDKEAVMVPVGLLSSPDIRKQFSGSGHSGGTTKPQPPTNDYGSSVPTGSKNTARKGADEITYH